MSDGERRRILVAAMITCFNGSFMGSSINVAVPAMAEEFGMNPDELTWVLTAFLIAAAAGLLPFGRLADIKGRRKIYLLGLYCICIATFGCALAGSYEVMVAMRFAQGFAMSMIFGTCMAYLVSCYPPQSRGKVIGLTGAFVYGGLSVGPFIGGFFTEFYSWRMIFAFTGIAMLVNLILMLKVKTEWAGDAKQKFDYTGAAVYAAMIILFLYSLSSWSASENAGRLLFLSAVLFALFIWMQYNAKSPLLKLSLFKNITFAMSNAAALIHYSATFALSFVLSLYLQVVRGMDAFGAGMLLLIQPIVMALLSPKAGALSDKFPSRIIASFGMAIMMVSIFAFSFIDRTEQLYLIGINLAFVGLGFALFSAPNNNAILSAAPKRFYGIASSVLAAMRLTGQALSMAIVSLLLSSFAADAVQDNYVEVMLTAFQHIFRLFAILCVFALVASLARGGQNNCE